MKLIHKIKLYFLEKFIKLLLLKERVYIKKIVLKSELDQVRNFVWKIYAVEKKYIDPNFFPNEMFIDEFDEFSVYFSAFKEKEIIGVVRLVLNSQLGFPIEKAYRLNPLPIDRTEIAEISRLIVIDNMRKKDIVALALCSQCFRESLFRGIKYWYAFLPQKLKNYFEKKYRIQFIELKQLPLTANEQSYRKPYRCYFLRFDPKPFLIPLEKILDNFKI